MNKIFSFLLICLLSLSSLFAVELPDGLNYEKYILTADDYDNGQVQYDAYIAIDGEDAYLGNFAYNAKNVWIKGKANGNVLTFPEDQMVTKLSDGSEIWFYGVDITADGISSSDFTLTYDAEADEYTANCCVMLTLGRPTAQLNYLEILQDVLISKTGRRIELKVEFSKTIITQQPAGELKHYARSGPAYVNFYNSPTADVQDGMVLNMVYASDGKTVYMQAPISLAGTTNWVKGYIEGNKLHVPLYQSIVKDGNNFGITGICRWNKSHTFLEPYLRAKEITFTIDPITGIITQDGDDAYVLLWSQDMSWSKYADLNIVYTPFDANFTTIPSDLTKEEMAVTYKLDDGTESRLVVTGAHDLKNDKYYIAGLSAADPQAAIVGDVSGNTIVFPSNQYLGQSAKCLSYFSAATYTIRDEEFGGMIFHFLKLNYLDELKLTRNNETGIWSTESNVAITLNKGMAREGFVNYYSYQLCPMFEAYDEQPSTPSDPEIARYKSEMATGGYDCLNLLIKTEDADGRFINPKKLSYQLFVDVNGKIEPYVIKSDEYIIPDDMEEIPFVFYCRDLANSTDIAIGGSEIYLYETGFDNIGVQVINHSGGVDMRSNLVWWKSKVDYKHEEPFADPVVTKPEIASDAQSVVWGYYNGTQNLGSWGTNKGETYHIAMKLNNNSLAGNVITSVKVPFNSFDVTDCNLWLVRDNLWMNTGEGEAESVRVPFVPGETWTEVILPEEYTITDGDLYIGVSFTASANNKQPLLLCPTEKAETTFVRTSRTYRKWMDLSGAFGAVLPLQLTVKGDVAKQNAVSVLGLSNAFVKHDESVSITATVANTGSNAVTGFDWVYTLGNQTTQGHAYLSISAEYYGEESKFEFMTPAIETVGTYEGVLTIVSVNDMANTSKANTGKNSVKVMNVVPKKRPLMEEFTGTWCGYCPSGFVAMQLMNERHPEDFVCASYHNKDAMQITLDYPVVVDAFPTSCIDRNHYTDPYKGDLATDMGIDETWKKECEELSPVNVEVEATIESGVIKAISRYEICEDIASADYGIAYIVTADSLCGTGVNWRQHNYYSKEFNGGVNSGMYKEGMSAFNNGAEYMFLAYDDVAIGTSGEAGQTISGVVAAECKEGDVFTHEYTFNASDLNSNYGPKSNLVQNVNKLHVIALVYDNATKHVLNCAKCDVRVADAESVSAIQELGSTVSQRFSIDGRRVATRQNGITIEILDNGTARKVFNNK